MGSCASTLTEDLKMDECHALLPTDAVWKERVTELIPAHLFSLFLVHKVANPAMYFVTWIDNHGICAADSLAQNATKIQFASKEIDEEEENSLAQKK